MPCGLPHPSLALLLATHSACAVRCMYLARFQPYRVAGGVSKRSSRGPQSGGRKWGHDLFDPNQEATAAADEEAAADAGAMME